MSLELALSQTIASSAPVAGVRIWWLSQSGFAVRFAGGPLVTVDPCLSDAVERLHGFKRLSLPAIAAEDLPADWLLCTHEHADHLDPDAVATIARQRPSCRFIGPSSCRAGFDAAGIAEQRRQFIAAGQTLDLGGFQVQAIKADHADLAPDALMLVLSGAGVRIAFTGDTAWNIGNFANLVEPRCDVIFACINGGFGNMSHLDAARAIQQTAPRLAIPCHFFTFSDQGTADPLGFLHACAALAPTTRTRLLSPGEALDVLPA
ncbi:hypothetical protein LBMAG53_37390 [Planctomycetota bacterium]|nr:hypothetical protein LBMAG53_37390 [Planctomycetota bacterium]